MRERQVSGLSGYARLCQDTRDSQQLSSLLYDTVCGAPKE